MSPKRRAPLEGRTVLVTGAARGLGRALALRLAAGEGADLVLVDRDEARLREVAEQVRRLCPRAVRCIPMDLLAPGAPRRLFEALGEQAPWGLVNNAGLTYYGPTVAAELPRFASIIDLDFRVTAELSLLFLARLPPGARGAFLLNVTSLAAFVPIPYQSVYAAAKAAAQSFSESLRAENRRPGPLIATLAPSGLCTDMVTESGLGPHMRRHGYCYLSPERAARVAVRGLRRGRALIIPGAFNKLLYVLLGIVPRPLSVFLARAVYSYERYGPPRPAAR